MTTLAELIELQNRAIARAAEKFLARRARPFKMDGVDATIDTFLDTYGAQPVFDEPYTMVYFKHREDGCRQESVGLGERELFASEEAWAGFMSDLRIKSTIAFEDAKKKAFDEGYRNAICRVRELVEEWGIEINTCK